MATCPSCGRYVGPTDADTCSYCGARLTGRMTLRALKIGALSLAVLGLILLWWFATHSPLPVLKIGQAQATMNFAYVRVEGQVTRAPSYDPDSGYLNFWIADDTGEMLVSSYRATTQVLVNAGQMPFIGDRVTVEGTLRIRQDSVSLTLNSADAIHIQRSQPERMDIGRIGADAALRAVKVRGQVRTVRIPYKGLTLVTLRDVTGEIDVAVPDADSTLNVQPGQSAEATGTVTLYKDTPQVALARADALSFLTSPDSIPVAAPAHVADLTAERAGQWAAVRGQVVKVSPFSAGIRFALDDGTGRANVVLWQDVYAVLSPTFQLAEGAQVAVQGEVSLYRGAVEIVPEIPADVVLIAAAPIPATPTLAPTLSATPTALPATIVPTPTVPPPTLTPRPTPRPTQAIALMPMGQLTPADKGKLVSVRGKIVEVIKFSSGMKYRLNDGTGQVILLLWQEVFDQVPGRDKLVNGAQVSATGEVDVYRGDIEVIPRSGADVRP
jgi:DNA/RNA endonuclease YhcR with UshA esterase domain